MEGKLERYPDLVAELVALNVLVVGGGPAGMAAKKATKTIPVVMAISDDAVESGLIASLARPGGNLTGLTFPRTELGGKRLQLLKEAVPGASRVAVLWTPALEGSGLLLNLKGRGASAAFRSVSSIRLGRSPAADGNSAPLSW